jgi:hypothetical protein
MLKDQINDQKVRLGVIREKLSYEFNIELESILDTLYTPEASFGRYCRTGWQKFAKGWNNLGKSTRWQKKPTMKLKSATTSYSEQKQDLVKAKESLIAND